MALRQRITACAALAAAALAIAGCGGGGGGGSDDPATVAPANAPVYLQATLRPTGQLKTNAGDAISTVTGETDPGKAIVDLINQQLQSSANDSDVTSYEKDIQPWLGEKAGLFLDRFTNGDA